MSDKHHIAAVLIVICLFSALVLTLYHYRQELRIPNLILHPIHQGRKTVNCFVFTTIGTKQLRMGFSIPSEDRRHRDELIEKLPRIQHDLQMSSSEPDWSSWIEERNFRAIKGHLLKVVNRHSAKPVKNLYFESFFFD